jgi:hypothetical protein
MKETFLNIDFFRTLMSVLIGGLISLGSILIIEKLKIKKEQKEKKRRVYNGLISTINSLRRTEITTLQNGVFFNYHKRAYIFDNDEKNKQQGEYHQQNKDKGIDKISEKSEKLDLYALEYKNYIKNDTEFDALINYFFNWPRPLPPDYTKTETLKELNKIQKSDLYQVSKFTKNYWDIGVENLNNHISKKLL